MDEIRIGSYMLKPRRQLACGGQPVPLGKRALDILSTLAEADGEILTKDELLASVWPGAIVEENALQVHMVALRRALGNDAERLKTIRGVGYQLQIGNGHAEPLSPARSHGIGPEQADGRDHGAAFVRRWSRGRWTLAALAAAGLGAAIVAASWRPNASQGQEIVRVEPIAGTGGDAARLLSVTLHDNIVQVFNQTNVQIASPRRTGWFGGSNATQVLRGTVAQSAGRLHVDLFLDDAASGTTLWSRQFERDLGASDTLSTEASAAAARTIYTIRELDLQRGVKLDAETIALYIRGEDLLRSAHVLDRGAARRTLEEVVARAPNSAPGHGSLAMALVGEGRQPGPGAAGALAKATEEARTAIRIDHFGAGAGYDALFLLAETKHPREIIAAEDGLLPGLDKAPQFAFLWMRECRLLMEVGRARASLPVCQRALALHPFAEPIMHSYATALSETGQDQEAADAMDRAASYNPDHLITRQMRVELAAFGGRPAQALALLQNPQTRPPQMSSAESTLMQRYLHDAGKWSVDERQDLATRMTALALHRGMAIDEAVMALTALGHRDEAFEILRSPLIDATLSGPGVAFLFQPVTAPLRADPRFWRAAVDLGLAQYWLARDKWPDMCGDEVPLPVCKAQAAQAVRSAG